MLGRLLRSGPIAVYGMLQSSATTNDVRCLLPWTSTLLSDMLALKESLANEVSELGCIHSNWNRWSNIIHDQSSWKALVDEFVARAVKYHLPR